MLGSWLGSILEVRLEARVNHGCCLDHHLYTNMNNNKAKQSAKYYKRSNNNSNYKKRKETKGVAWRNRKLMVTENLLYSRPCVRTVI